MRKQLETEIQVGLFLTVGMGLIMLAILMLGGNESFFSSKLKYSAHFSSVEGLIPGAKVILGGVSVGTVETIEFDKQKRNIQVNFAVNKEAADWIRKDSTVEIATQGVLGDKYLSLQTGNMDEPPMPPGSDVPHRPARDLTQFLSKGDQLLVSLNRVASSLDRILGEFEAEDRSKIFFKGLSTTAKNLSLATDKINDELDQIKIKAAVGNLNQIFEKINNGTGTLGALVNDPSLYDEVRALIGGANRNRIIRNLVRQTIKNSSEEPSSSPEPTPNPSK